MGVILRELYEKGLKRFAMPFVATNVLRRVIAGDDKAEDYEEAIRVDPFLSRQIILSASEAVKRGTVKSLAHAVVLLGKDPVRDFILGHNLVRSVDAQADTAFDKMSRSQERLKRALLAEELARSCQCDYLGGALAGGYVFDLFENWIMSDPGLTASFQGTLERTWKHSLRTAVICWFLANHKSASVNMRKLSFGAGLLHEVGRLLLCCVYPVEYQKAMEQYDKARETSLYDDAFEVIIDRQHFNVTHAEIGSLLLWQTGYLHEWEEMVDFHHDFGVLKLRNPELYQLVLFLNIADRIAVAVDRNPGLTLDDLKNILKAHQKEFPLSRTEVMDILIMLRTKQLLV